MAQARKIATFPAPQAAAPADKVPDDTTPTDATLVPDIGEPIDLGKYDPKLTGCLVYFVEELTLEMSEQAAIIVDKNVPAQEKSRPMRLFLEQACIGWNLTRVIMTPQGPAVQDLPQPYDGGVRCISKTQLNALFLAVKDAVFPDPNG